MKKLRVNWPAIIGISVALALVSCHNEKKAEDYRQQQVHNNTQRIEQALDEAMDKLLNTPVEQIVYPENVQVEEKGFSK